MRAARLLALRAARPRWGQLAAAGSQASAISSAASTAGFNSLRAARQQQDGLFCALDLSPPGSSSSAPRAAALAAAASAGGPADGSATFGGGRSGLARASRSMLAPPFAQHASTHLSGSSAAGARAAEAELPPPPPSRLTSAESGGRAPLMGGWPWRVEERRLRPTVLGAGLGRGGRHCSRAAASPLTTPS
jgi:hypothetical protein